MAKEKSKNKSKNKSKSPLDEQISALDQDSEWVVLETFKQTEFELTQKVVKETEDGSVSGPFIRKEFSPESRQGQVYNQIWLEQWKGRQLSHCPKLQEYYEYAGTRVVILDYVEGVTLEKYIRENEPTNAQIKRIFADICEAVRELHLTFEAPLIHRDLKPTNIIVHDESVCIIDFGIARFQRGGFTPDTTQFGTPAFAPPEQYGFGETSVESDIYALGMVLYFMLTKKLSKTPLRDNATFDEEIPSEFKQVLLKATSFDPQERYHSALAMESALLEAPESTYSQVYAGPQGVADQIAAESGTSTAQIRNKLSLTTLREKLGAVYNGALLALWAVVVLVVVGATVMPDDQGLQYSLAARIVGYFGCVAIPVSAWAFVLMDKSRLKQRYPWMQKLTLKWLIFITVLSFLFMLIAGFISGLV